MDRVLSERWLVYCQGHRPQMTWKGDHLGPKGLSSARDRYSQWDKFQAGIVLVAGISRGLANSQDLGNNPLVDYSFVCFVPATSTGNGRRVEEEEVCKRDGEDKGES